MEKGAKLEWYFNRIQDLSAGHVFHSLSSEATNNDSNSQQNTHLPRWAQCLLYAVPDSLSRIRCERLKREENYNKPSLKTHSVEIWYKQELLSLKLKLILHFKLFFILYLIITCTRVKNSKTTFAKVLI